MASSGISSRRAFSFDESPKSISSNVQHLQSRLIYFSRESAKSFYSSLGEFSRGKKWATIVFITGLAAVAIPLYPATKDIIKDASAKSVKIAPKIKDSIAKTSEFDVAKRDGKFVNRPILSSSIEEILGRKKVTKSYTIVYGAKGVGKSTMIDSVVQGRRGVLKIPVTSNTSKEEITIIIAQRTGTTTLNPENSDFVDAMRIGHGDDGIVPTIIFEIERGSGAEQKDGLQSIRSLAKEFAVACNVILVLSEANAALEFGRDLHREDFIYVDELTELEARELLTALEVKLSEADIKYLIDNVGTNPAAFQSLQVALVKGMSLQDFVTSKLKRATAELLAFQHQQILKALKEHPEGVSPAYFNKMKSEGVDLSDPRAVAVGMKAVNALTYRIELSKYVMLSRCHEVALRTYKPIVPRWWSRFS